MISLELAKKLKDAGLEWEPKEGDWRVRWLQGRPYRILTNDIETDFNKKDKHLMSDIWLPSLSQLLAEIERRKNLFNLGSIDASEKGAYVMMLWSSLPGVEYKGKFHGDTSGEAAGQALLWILEQGK